MIINELSRNMVIIGNGVCEGGPNVPDVEVGTALDSKRVLVGCASEGVRIARDKIIRDDRSAEIVVMAIVQWVTVAISNLNGAIDRCSCRRAIRTDTMARVTHMIHVTMMGTSCTVGEAAAGFFIHHIVLVTVMRMTDVALRYWNDGHVVREVHVKAILAREGVLAPPRSSLAGITSAADLLGHRPLRWIQTNDEIS
jgi:hypothetical protein